MWPVTRQKEFAEKYQRRKGAAEKNPLSVLQKAYLYQNLVDEFGAEPGGMAISQISFLSYSLWQVSGQLLSWVKAQGSLLSWVCLQCVQKTFLLLKRQILWINNPNFNTIKVV